jgi:hypothetical protein
MKSWESWGILFCENWLPGDSLVWVQFASHLRVKLLSWKGNSPTDCNTEYCLEEENLLINKQNEDGSHYLCFSCCNTQFALLCSPGCARWLIVSSLARLDDLLSGPCWPVWCWMGRMTCCVIMTGLDDLLCGLGWAGDDLLCDTTVHAPPGRAGLLCTVWPWLAWMTYCVFMAELEDLNRFWLCWMTYIVVLAGLEDLLCGPGWAGWLAVWLCGPGRLDDLLCGPGWAGWLAVDLPNQTSKDWISNDGTPKRQTLERPNLEKLNL